MNFCLFMKNKRLIIHNANFGLSHLNNELSLIGKKITNEVVDTLAITKINFQDLRLV